jgi:hypothetical protein
MVHGMDRRVEGTYGAGQHAKASRIDDRPVTTNVLAIAVAVDALTGNMCISDLVLLLAPFHDVYGHDESCRRL